MIIHGHKYIIVTWGHGPLAYACPTNTLTTPYGPFIHCFELATGKLIAWSKSAPHLEHRLRMDYKLDMIDHHPRVGWPHGVKTDNLPQPASGFKLEQVLYFGIVMECSSSNDIPDGLFADNPPTSG